MAQQYRTSKTLDDAVAAYREARATLVVAKSAKEEADKAAATAKAEWDRAVTAVDNAKNVLETFLDQMTRPET